LLPEATGNRRPHIVVCGDANQGEQEILEFLPMPEQKVRTVPYEPESDEFSDQRTQRDKMRSDPGGELSPTSAITPPHEPAAADDLGETGSNFPTAPGLAAHPSFAGSPPHIPEPPEGAPVVRLRGPNPNAFVSWVVILVSFSAILILMQLRANPQKNQNLSSASSPVVAKALQQLGDPRDDISLLLLEETARVVILNPEVDADQIRQMLQQYGMKTNTPEVMMRLAIVRLYQSRVGQVVEQEVFDDLNGAAQLHQDRLKAIPHDEWPTWATQFEDDLSLVTDLVKENRKPSPDESSRLRARLGSIGDMFIAHFAGVNSNAQRMLTRRATRMAVAIVLAAVIAFLATFTGFVLFIVGIVFLATGKIRFRLNPNRLFSTQSSRIFLEAFAVYFATIAFVLALFYALNIPDTLTGMAPIVVGSVLGVCWPFLRGLPRRRALLEMGWSRGRGFFREMFAGFVGYLSLIPIYLMGAVLTFVLIIVYQSVIQAAGQPIPNEPMSHPIVVPLIRGDLWVKLLLLGLASGFAPFFEETMFRGALYGALRKRLPIALAAPIMAFIFAAIHPQGFLAIPVLMSLAIGFGLLREWRGSLIAPMTAHAIHNGFLIGIVILAF